MAKVKGTLEAQARATAILNAAIKDPALLNEIGEAVVRDIKGQTRTGKSLPTEDRFKPLTDGWIERRREIKAAGGTSNVFSPGRSNLTVTGQLIDSIKHIINRGTVQIEASGPRSPYQYKTKDGEVKTIPTDLDNATLSKYVSVDRPFIGLRAEMRERVVRIAQAFLRRALRARR